MAEVVRRLVAGLAVVVLGLSLTACGGDDGDFHGHAISRPYRVPTAALTDTDGHPYSLAEQTDKRLTLTYFGYTRCDDVCPAVLNHLASAMTRISDADRAEVDVVFVSSDPTYDTAERLRTYLHAFDPSFIGVRADLDTTIEVGKVLGVGIDRSDAGGHTSQILGIDNHDEVPVYWREDTTASQFAADIHTLLNGD